MKNFDATHLNGAPMHCLVCQQEIPPGNWFARIKIGDRRCVFCRPRCVEVLLDDREKYSERAINGN